MNAAEARAVSDVRPERAGGWGRKAVIPAMLIVVVAAGVTWLNVVRTIRDPEPLSIPDRPPVAGVVWSNRVFIHERSLKRWLEARGQSYAVWARKHPRAVAVLRDRPLPAVAAAARKPQRQAAGAAAASDDLGLTTLALLVAGLLGAIALLLVAARRTVTVVLDRSSGLPRLDAPSLRRASRAAWRGLARTALGAVTAARAGVQALSERLAARWADGRPTVHRGPSSAPPLRERLGARWAEARAALPRRPEPRGPDLRTRLATWRAERRPSVRRSPDARGPDLRTRLAEWWADVAPRDPVPERLGESAVRDRMERLYDAFADALETLSDYRLRVALWGLTAVIAAAGLTFLVSQATQP